MICVFSQRKIILHFGSDTFFALNRMLTFYNDQLTNDQQTTNQPTTKDQRPTLRLPTNKMSNRRNDQPNMSTAESVGVVKNELTLFKCV
jgi:hypothetical protein